MDLALLTSLANPLDGAGQARALAYFEQLKGSDNGWQLAVTSIVKDYVLLDDQAKFFALQVIEWFAKRHYGQADPSAQQLMRGFLSQYIQILVSQASPDKAFLRNKAAQVFALVCVVDFPDRWPSFFADLLRTLNLGARAVDLYLRVLLAIDCEVVDRDIVHSKAETDRNTRIKDTMRETCVQQLVDSWYQILTLYESTEPELLVDCLNVVGCYVSWIDVSLVANDRFVPVLVRLLQHGHAPTSTSGSVREAAADCLAELVSKGMEPITKLKLVDSLSSVLEANNVFQLQDEDDCDYLIKLGKLLNAMGTQLCLCWAKLKKGGDRVTLALVLASLLRKATLAVQFLAHTDDDVSASVLDFLKEYIQLLKQKGLLESEQNEQLRAILYVLMRKLQYDESFDFDHDGEEEATFLEYRKQLKVLFDNIGGLDRELLLNQVRAMVEETLTRWQESTVPALEAAIILLYWLGEALPASHGNHFSGDPSKASVLQPLMCILVGSGISNHPHPAVGLQFLETCVRYEKFFAVQPQWIPQTLAAFIDHRGLHHPSPKVRSRAAYLFSRFVRTPNKGQLTSYTEDVLRQLSDLLLPAVSDKAPQGVLLTPDDQLFIFEAAGILIVNGDFPVERKQILMQNLLSPVLDRFIVLLEEGLSNVTPNPNLGAQLSHAISCVAWASKAFSNHSTIQSSGCLQAYLDALQVFLRAGQLPETLSEVQAGLRQFLHRMVVCLGDELLPFIGPASQVLLKAQDFQALSEYIPLINQIISKYKKTVGVFLTQAFVPIVSALFAAQAALVDESDEEVRLDKQSLQRSYFSFISALLAHGLSEVLTVQDPDTLQRVLMSIIQGAVEGPDPVAQRSAFSILKRLVELWGGKEGPTGFREFVFARVVPACFMAPLRDTFDLGDAQTTLALSESALCLRAIYEKWGDELLEFLQLQYLPSLKVPSERAVEYCAALKSDLKAFKTFNRLFFQQARP